MYLIRYHFRWRAALRISVLFADIFVCVCVDKNALCYAVQNVWRKPARRARLILGAIRYYNIVRTSVLPPSILLAHIRPNNKPKWFSQWDSKNKIRQPSIQFVHWKWPFKVYINGWRFEIQYYDVIQCTMLHNTSLFNVQ